MKKLKIFGWIFSLTITLFCFALMILTYPYGYNAADVLGYVILGIIFSVSSLIACLIPIIIGAVGIRKGLKLEDNKERKRTVMLFIIIISLPVFASSIYFASLFIVDTLSNAIQIG